MKPGDGEVVVQITYLSMDAAMRAWMQPVRTYMEPLQIGEVMRSTGLGVVVEAGQGSKFSVGDLVTGGNIGMCKALWSSALMSVTAGVV